MFFENSQKNHFQSENGFDKLFSIYFLHFVVHLSIHFASLKIVTNY